MTSDAAIALPSAFAHDVLHGLAQTPKCLPCKWFYDETGSQLFEAITATPEYYPTRAETRLLRQLAGELPGLIPGLASVIEPGSGASIKTRILLQALPQLQRYIPIDISEDFLLQAAAQLRLDFPRLEISPHVADFSQPMIRLPLGAGEQPMVFFPGSTIGNFSPAEARRLLRNMRLWAGENAWLLIGVDTTQHVPTLLAAYNDAAGITARFNRNLLVRANRELGADFQLECFRHQATFNPQESRVEMHLVSTIEQQVHIQDAHYHFAKGESIHTENCYKYTEPAFLAMAHACGWQHRCSWQDPQQSAFAVFLLQS